MATKVSELLRQSCYFFHKVQVIYFVLNIPFIGEEFYHKPFVGWDELDVGSCQIISTSINAKNLEFQLFICNA